MNSQERTSGPAPQRGKVLKRGVFGSKLDCSLVNKPYKLTVKAVISDDQNRCLLIRRSDHSTHCAGQWEWPGGKLDDGEDFATALAREVGEETGLAIEITGLAGATEFEMPLVKVVMLCMEVRVVAGEVRLSEEHDDFRWIALSELSSCDLTEHVRPFMLEYSKRKESV